MEKFVNELQNATDFVKELFAAKQIHLDYSIESVQHLDALFDKEFHNGEPVDKSGIIAQYQGLIITGVSGYITQVILSNTNQVQLSSETDDKNYYINFSLEKEGGFKLMPGHQVLKRVCKGDELGLHAFVISAINYFNNSKMKDDHKVLNTSSLNITTSDQKHWWKLW